MRPKLKRQWRSALACRALAWALLGAVGVAAWAGGPEPIGKEYQVKAAFLYNFLKFVGWPATNSPAPEAPLVIGVAGDGPMLAALTETVKGRRIGRHALVVRPLRRPVEAKTTQVLFVPASENKRVGQWLGQAHGAAILTVGESEGFAREHGMINFLRVEDKVRFEIDARAADQAGLTISAQLQKLARRVRKDE